MVNVLLYVGGGAVLGGIVAWMLKPPSIKPVGDLVKAYKAGKITDREMIVGVYKALRWSERYPPVTEAEIQHELTGLHVVWGDDVNLWVSMFLNGYRIREEVAEWTRRARVPMGDFLF